MSHITSPGTSTSSYTGWKKIQETMKAHSSNFGALNQILEMQAQVDQEQKELEIMQRRNNRV